MKKGSIATPLLLLAFLWTSQLVSASSNSFNTKYLRADRFMIDTSQTYNNSLTPDWNPLNYIVSLSGIFDNVSSVSIVLALDDLNVEHNQSRFQFKSSISAVTESQFTLEFNSDIPKDIKSLGYRYLILINDYSSSSSNLMVQSYLFNINLNISTSKSALGTISYSQPLLVESSSIVFVPFITGINITATSSSNIFDIGIDAIGNSTYIKFSITSGSTTPTYVKYICINLLIYNSDFYNRKQFAEFTNGQIVRATPLQYYSPGSIYQPNVMVGLGGFQFTQASWTDFSIGFDSPNLMFVSSEIPSSKVKLNYLIMKTFSCAPPTPYYSENKNICVEKCEKRTGLDQSNKICKACPYDCLTCDSTGNCLTCSPQDNRALNGSRCSPLPGYFDAYVAVCRACPLNCLSCLSDSVCQTCLQGYYLSSTSCAIKNVKNKNSQQGQQGDENPSIVKLVAFILIGVFILIVILLIGFCFIRKRNATVQITQKSDIASIHSGDIDKYGSFNNDDLPKDEEY